MKKISIVVSIYNEEDSIEIFFYNLIKELKKLNISYEIILVNDGSKDLSLEKINKLVLQNDFVKVVNFSRNFGHESAMIAGIDYSKGDAVICMDADMQHPPNKIAAMIDKYLEGYDIINMIREGNKGNSKIKEKCSAIFYATLSKASGFKFEKNASDFFLISRRICEILKFDYRERNRFIRGFIQIVGFNKTTLRYSAPKRVAGKSKYSIKKLFKMFFDVIFSFSKIPLTLGVYLGFMTMIFSIGLAGYSFVMKLIGEPPSGYTTIVVTISMFFSIMFLILGILGKYIGYIVDEIKQRPLYLVESVYNNVEVNRSIEEIAVTINDKSIED